MVDKKRLVKLIKKEKSAGFTIEQIKRSMLATGWPEDLINEAIEEVEPGASKAVKKPAEISGKEPTLAGKEPTPAATKEKSSLPIKKIITTLVVVAVVIGLIWLVSSFFSSPVKAKSVCGNGILEVGETSTTCCEDAGCPNGKECKDGACTTSETEIPTPSTETPNATETPISNVTETNITPQVGPKPCKFHRDCDDNNPDTRDYCNFSRDFKSAWCVNVGAEADECQTDADCDDGEVWSEDKCIGTPKKCYNEIITKCEGGDNYCPSDCTPENDLDCSNITKDGKCENMYGKVCPAFSICTHPTDYTNQEAFIPANDTEYCCPAGSTCTYGDLYVGNSVEVKYTSDVIIYFNYTSTFNLSLFNVAARVYNGTELINIYTLDNIQKGIQEASLKYCTSCSKNITGAQIKIEIDSTDIIKETDENNNVLIRNAVLRD